jgi:orotate phosphoribosyltransferase
MQRNELARRIYDRSHLSGTFVLRSGATSNEYFDKYLFESDPELLELGGVPLATVLSKVTGLPALFVRKQAKEYGTCRLAEGGEVAGRRLTLVEDVVTSGGQVKISGNDLRERGGVVSHAVCVIDREAGGRESLQAGGIELVPLFRMSELTSA